MITDEIGHTIWMVPYTYTADGHIMNEHVAFLAIEKIRG